MLPHNVAYCPTVCVCVCLRVRQVGTGRVLTTVAEDATEGVIKCLLHLLPQRDEREAANLVPKVVCSTVHRPETKKMVEMS